MDNIITSPAIGREQILLARQTLDRYRSGKANLEQRVIEGELTELQRETILAYYFQQKNICLIAKERGVNKSTVCRTLHRAEARIRRCLKY